jgi:hypothetical protein
MTRGGRRDGAGRPTKVDEQKANVIFLNALKTVYDSETEQQAKEKFVIDLMQNIRGKMYIAEHLFGKSKEYIQTENITQNSMELTTNEMNQLK